MVVCLILCGLLYTQGVPVNPVIICIDVFMTYHLTLPPSHPLLLCALNMLFTHTLFIHILSQHPPYPSSPHIIPSQQQTLDARAQRAMLLEAELSAKLLEESWPDYRELAAARIQEQEANTPIPERVWALRNVARTLAMGGMGERTRARGLLEQAVGLKQVYCGGPDHPGALPELLSLYQLLSSVEEWQEDTQQAAKDVVRLVGVVAAGYADQGDPLSAVVLLVCGCFTGEMLGF